MPTVEELIEQLPPEFIEAFNQYEPLLTEFKRTPIIEAFLRRPEDLIFLETGNQFGKTFTVIYSYLLRILGYHPIEFKNLRPHCPIRTIRMASEKLPLGPEEGKDSNNTIYPALKQLLPSYLIKKDITSRNKTMTLYDPQGGDDVHIEFVAYTQPDETQAGIQRFSVYLDENSPKTFFEEQKPRLWATKKYGYGGDIIMTLTPVKHLGWQHSEIFEKASVYIRTPRIVNAIKRYFGKTVSLIEHTDQPTNIAVIQAATDDNPEMSNIPKHCNNPDCINLEKQGISPQFERLLKDNTGYRPYQCKNCGNKTYGLIDIDCIEFGDDDLIAIRRYGISKQIMGVIFRSYDPRIHTINPDKYFPDGISYNWLHARAIDYHPLIKWAIIWVALSPTNEVFVYDEFNPDPRKFITLQISDQIIGMSGDYTYYLNLIDPLAAQVQPNTGLSILDDLNRIFREKRNMNCGTGGIWQTWDSKSDIGRDIIKQRLANSRLVGQPFSNKRPDPQTGLETYLPTLWIFNRCLRVNQSLKSWREQQWVNREKLITNDEKGKPEQKYSHFPMCLEALFKHPAFRISRYQNQLVAPRKPAHRGYFHGALSVKTQRR